MEIAIRSRNIEVSEPLRSTVEEKIAHLGRFLEGLDRAEVQFSQERNPRISDKESCEVTVHGHGHVVRASATGPDQFVAVDRVVDKLEHQMGKLKGKLLGRSHPRAAYSGNGRVSPDGLTEEEQEVNERPRSIVKSKQFAIKPMTADEAVLQMDLLSHDFFLFTNAETGKAALVYHRKDGDIGLIDVD